MELREPSEPGSVKLTGPPLSPAEAHQAQEAGAQEPNGAGDGDRIYRDIVETQITWIILEAKLQSRG